MPTVTYSLLSVLVWLFIWSKYPIKHGLKIGITPSLDLLHNSVAFSTLGPNKGRLTRLARARRPRPPAHVPVAGGGACALGTVRSTRRQCVLRICCGSMRSSGRGRLRRLRTPGHAFAMREHWSKVAPSAGSAQGFCASGCGCLVRVRVRVRVTATATATATATV